MVYLAELQPYLLLYLAVSAYTLTPESEEYESLQQASSYPVKLFFAQG